MKQYELIVNGQKKILNKAEFSEFLATKPKKYTVKKIDVADIKVKPVQTSTQTSVKEHTPEKKLKYFAFYDSEFNCGYSRTFGDEVVSVGVVITDEKGLIVEEFYRTVRPIKVKKLAKRCIEITGLTQKEIDNSDDIIDVSAKLVNLLKKYEINKIYTFGTGDKLQLAVSRKFTNKKLQDILYVEKRMENVVNKLKCTREMRQMSLEKLKYICDGGNNVSHNALDDARDLSMVYFALKNGIYDPEKVDIIMARRKEADELIKERNNLISTLNRKNTELVSILLKNKHLITDKELLSKIKEYQPILDEKNKYVEQIEKLKSLEDLK